MGQSTIKQIIPAENWWAVFKSDDTYEGEPIVERLVCWALVEEECSQYVIGMIEVEGGADTADKTSGFVMHIYATNEEEAYIKAFDLFNAREECCRKNNYTLTEHSRVSSE
ncbi:hypothetical protein H5T51_06380 [Candidatus Bathyarchaeota archaeon]|nr:hypothetical protein [Candidatus Bathyarchaeota archaeon]